MEDIAEVNAQPEEIVHSVLNVYNQCVLHRENENSTTKETDDA